MQAEQLRIDTLRTKAAQVRQAIVTMIHTAQSGHPGGSLSAADIMTALYFDILRIDPQQPSWPERDRLILSKGHACPVWYACLALRGYFDPAHLATLRRAGSILQGHPTRKTPGIDMPTGSLGQGLSFGVGMALEGRMLEKQYRVFVILGDGELNEGQIWEAAAAANRYRLNNLIAIVDNNRLQMDGFSADVMPMEPIDRKFEAFGWETVRIDGHDMGRILATLGQDRHGSHSPLCIIADTVKGKGVDFMENVREWHGKVPDDAEYAAAMQQLSGRAA